MLILGDWLSIVAILISLVGFIWSRIDHKKDHQPNIKAEILGFADLINKKCYFRKHRDELLQKNLPDEYQSFVDDDKLQSYFRENGANSIGDGFWLDSFSDDLVSLFLISSKSNNRRQQPISSVVEFECENIKVREMQINQITVIKSKKKRVLYNIRYTGVNEILARHNKPFLNSSLFIALFEIYDWNDSNFRICDIDNMNPRNDLTEYIRYDIMRLTLKIISGNGEKIYFDIDGVPIGKKLEITKRKRISKVTMVGRWIRKQLIKFIKNRAN